MYTAQRMRPTTHLDRCLYAGGFEIMHVYKNIGAAFIREDEAKSALCVEERPPRMAQYLAGTSTGVFLAACADQEGSGRAGTWPADKRCEPLGHRKCVKLQPCRYLGASMAT